MDDFDLRAVQEAIQVLGYLTRAAEPTILVMLQPVPVEHPRAICIRYRRTGEQLSHDEKRTLGVRANAFLSRQAFSELTERGKIKPLQAHELTLLRAEFTRSRKRTVDNLQKPEWGQVRQHASFRHDPSTLQCAGCKRLKALGKVAADSVQIMPPIDCETETCNLAVSMDVDWLARHLGENRT
jgi:hypothetical protein